MRKISNATLLSVFTKIFILVLIAKTISLGIWAYLPNSGIDHNAKKSYQPKYQRVDFKNMLKTIGKGSVGSSGKNSLSIKNMILNGLYGMDDSGFVIVSVKGNPKATILEVGESFKGYKLKLIHSSSALFEKNGRDYVLKLQMIEIGPLIKSVEPSVSSSAVHADVTNSVSRKDIEHYSKNPDLIWRDISIVELNDGKTINGFKITGVRKGSKMAALGLKRADVIIKANNVTLDSYTKVLGIYENMETLDVMQIVIQRDNQEMEFVYEIN